MAGAGVKIWAAVWLCLATVHFVAGQVQHVVGEDRGWEAGSDVASWSSARNFRVGDNIWFTYSVAHGMIAELRTEEEYLSCDVRNAIKNYANGLDIISLDGVGIRYFASSNLESCKKGLKLPVHVMPIEPSDVVDPKKVSTSESLDVADGPTTPSPSVSAHLGAGFIMVVAAFLVFYTFI
ncbi:hypothetical protein M5689_009828 [Euphorbia peplus]|nr:hypothetical protein M5689_009828 [Euphorbia peplus]